MGVLCQRPKGLVISFLLLLALLFSVSASAQITSQTGAVRVFVTDPQGAAVAGAKVTLSPTSTHLLATTNWSSIPTS